MTQGALQFLAGTRPDAISAAGRAVKRAGLDYDELRGHRAPIRRADVLREEPRLVMAARRRFGSWRAAVLGAGLEVQGNRRWTERRISAAPARA